MDPEVYPIYMAGWVMSGRLPSRRNEVITWSSELIDVTFVNPMIDFNYSTSLQF